MANEQSYLKTILLDVHPIKKSIEETKKSLKQLASDFKSTISDDLGNLCDEFKKAFSTSIKKAWSEATSAITYDLAHSSQYSSVGWSMLKTFGVTGKEAYGLDKAMADIGVSSESELMEALMQPEVANRFSERLSYWQSKYEENSTLSKTIQEFTQEWEDFKNDLINDALMFINDYKNEIKAVLEFGAVVLKGLASIIGNIVRFFSGGRYDIPEASDIIKNYTNTNTVTNNSTVNMTVNGTDAYDIANSVTSYLQPKQSLK